MGRAELINLDTGLLEVFEADAEGVIRIPAGRYAPTVALGSQSIAVVRQVEKSVPVDTGSTLTGRFGSLDQQSLPDKT